jgi:hypothetical protein
LALRACWGLGNNEKKKSIHEKIKIVLNLFYFFNFKKIKLFKVSVGSSKPSIPRACWGLQKNEPKKNVKNKNKNKIFIFLFFQKIK